MQGWMVCGLSASSSLHKLSVRRWWPTSKPSSRIRASSRSRDVLSPEQALSPRNRDLNHHARSFRPSPMSVAILLPTWEDYAPVARLTLRQLDACWPAHPEVFVCGVATAQLTSATLLPVAADPSDWVGIALGAVRH